jgi:non-homologous end joining protein Ku
VTSKEIVSGYEYAKDQYVTVTDEELKGMQMASDKALAITEFCPADQVNFI